MSASPETELTIFKVKVRLLGASKPPVWRRLLVPAGIPLDQLHEAIQAAMGWENCHMHVFTTGSAEYGLPDPELGHRDERRTMLGHLVEGAGDRIRYTYDFGDDWEHEILVEDVLAAEPDVCYPMCLTGKGACPPEDCGGVWGYEQLREVLAEVNARLALVDTTGSKVVITRQSSTRCLQQYSDKSPRSGASSR